MSCMRGLCRFAAAVLAASALNPSALAAERRVSFYFFGGLPVGYVDTPGDGNGAAVIGFDAALGVRFAAHPQYSLGAQAGFLGVSPRTDAGSPLLVTSYGMLVFTFFHG